MAAVLAPFCCQWPICSAVIAASSMSARTGRALGDLAAAGQVAQTGRVDVGGSVQRQFEPVREVFAQLLAVQRGTGSAVAAWWDGAWVVDLWGGRADAAGTRRWQSDSLAQPYSVSKPFAAVCALLLVDRGQLELDAPVQRYWPQFRAAANVRQLLSHQAGVVALDEPAPTEAFYHWDWLCALLAAQEPAWEPGTAHGESALFYGHLVGELVRRVDGRGLGRFLREEVCGPLGLDFFVGLTAAEQARAVDVTGLEEYSREQAAGMPQLYLRAVTNPPGAFDPAVVNGRAWRAAEVPAVNGHGTARGAAGLYAALLQGKLLSAALLREATTAQCSGVDAVFGQDSAWGLGFGVDADSFGMGGSGGSYAGASVAGGYAFAFVTAAMGSHSRAIEVENVFRGCLGVPPLDE
jgi:CubicO group peptidase (beta-lactamase class C family)